MDKNKRDNINKPRLFCFGDSFVDWPVPTVHWTNYLEHHFEVIKFGKYGADNSSIIFQLGNLPEYKPNDRIVIVFTDPGRLPRRYYGSRKKQYEETPYLIPEYFNDVEFTKKLHALRYEEGNRWGRGERNNEVLFIKKLKILLNLYSPILFTWSSLFHQSTYDFVELIQVTSNYEEGVGDEKDFHPGPKGCYSIYKNLHGLLQLKDKPVDFIPYSKEAI